MNEAVPLEQSQLKTFLLPDDQSSSNEIDTHVNTKPLLNTAGSDDPNTKKCNVIVGSDPLSSRQARMEELKLLKSRGITRLKSVGLATTDANSTLNSIYKSKSPKVTNKKQHLVSIEYLQNSPSSQQARMEELKLLKLEGITRKKSSNMSSSDGFSDVNSFYTSQKCLKEAMKKKHLESMQYLHNYQNNDVAARKWKSQSTRFDSASPPITPSASHDLPERRDSPERSSDIEDDFPELPFPSLVDGGGRDETFGQLSVVESVSFTSESGKVEQDKSAKDREYADDTVVEVSVEDQSTQTNDVVMDIDEASQVMEDAAIIDSDILLSSSVEIEEATVLENNFHEQISSVTIKVAKEEHSEEAKDGTQDTDNVSHAELTLLADLLPNSSTPSPKSSRRTRSSESHCNEECSDKTRLSTRRRKNLPKLPGPKCTHTRPHKSKTIGARSRQSHKTNASVPELQNVISPESSDVDISLDSAGSRCLTGESNSKIVSDVSSQSSCDSTGFQPKRRRNSFSSKQPVRTSNSKDSKKSVRPSTTGCVRSVKLPKVGHVPIYEALLKKGIRKNTKREIPDSAMCQQKWEPKAHEDLSGCERCLGFANKKEMAAYRTNGHHHRIMMTRGGCCKSCKLFPRKDNQSTSRMCQRCFHDTHTMKLW